MICKICGDNRVTDFKVINNFKLLKCKKCKVIFLAEIEELVNYDKLYDEDYFENYLYESQIDFNSVRTTAKYYLDYIQFYFGQINSVLDVGAGFGLFVKAFRDIGLKAEGVEISRFSVKVAKEKFGITLFNGELKDFKSNEKYDLISFYHSFEHLPNPIQTLEKVNELLSEKGILWLSLPNISSLDRFINKDNWNGWSLPFHFFHYSPRTIKTLLKDFGFTHVRIQKSFLNPLKLIKRKNQTNNISLQTNNFSPYKELIRKPATTFLSGQNMNVFAQK